MFPATSKTRWLYQGDHRRMFKARFLKSKTDRTPQDLTAWILWRAAWKPSRDSDEVIELQVKFDYTTSTLELIVPADKSRAMAGRAGVWDVKATNSLGQPRTFLKGATYQTKDVTPDVD